MNLLVEKGVLQEIDCAKNDFAYLLSDNSLFLSTEYKVLQSQINSSFVRCMKMLYNGKIELYYLVENSRPLSTMLSRLEPEQFMIIAGNLLAGIIDVKSNGFLSCNNIDSTFEHIFVDQATLKVKLVYLPISQHEYQDDETFENALRTRLIQVISRIPRLSSSVKTTQFLADLRNGMLSIEEVYSRIGKKGLDSSFPWTGGKEIDGLYLGLGRKKMDEKKEIRKEIKKEILKGFRDPEPLMPGPQRLATMSLVALDAPTRMELKITKPEFVIGRRETNDGVIGYNNMVGRTHCKIIREGERYSICDLQSVNGTYVNGVRLQPNTSIEIKNGDTIRLANSSFRVIIDMR